MLSCHPKLDHGPEATEHLKAFIGDHYIASEKPVFRALWDSYNQCQFVEDEGTHAPLHMRRGPSYVSAGEILFYRDKAGGFVRQPDGSLEGNYVEHPPNHILKVSPAHFFLMERSTEKEGSAARRPQLLKSCPRRYGGPGYLSLTRVGDRDPNSLET